MLIVLHFPPVGAQQQQQHMRNCSRIITHALGAAHSPRGWLVAGGAKDYFFIVWTSLQEGVQGAVALDLCSLETSVLDTLGQSMDVKSM